MLCTGIMLQALTTVSGFLCFAAVSVRAMTVAVAHSHSLSLDLRLQRSIT
jgi:hypothetical protein